MSRVLATLRTQHPQLLAQLEAMHDLLETQLLPSATERLLADVTDLLHLGLSQPAGPPDTTPPAVLAALQAIDAHYGLTAGAAAAAGGAALGAAVAAPQREEWARGLGAERPAVLSAFLARVNAWRASLELEIASRPRVEHLQDTCWHLLRRQQPLVEVPCQYAADHLVPSPEQHVLLERFHAEVRVERSAATGETSRTLTLLGDDCAPHVFTLRVGGVLRPRADLAWQRVGQLTRLVNRRLLKSREARRRTLQLHAVPGERLGGGAMLLAARPAALSLAQVAARASADAGQPAHATQLAQQRTLARAPEVGELDAEGRRLRLRAAFDEACAGTGDELLARALRAGVPSAEELWELQRGVTSQLGLHALLAHTLGLRVSNPHTMLIARDSGALLLTDFALPAAGAASGGSAAAPPAVPFRLSRNLVHFVSPFGVDGAFSGAFSAAAECCADEQKCPLELWLDFLGADEPGAAAASDALGHFPPWSAPGSVAKARMRELSPQLIVRAHHPKRHQADVHEKLRNLIDQATSASSLSEMPPAWQPWL
eukprot:Transcript_26185.p2 GENE.Transcript_26185~~Transcript_26185.p2  ORF type:complete len:544 (+),score=249.13 Transcript_26185:705-2336(+)